MTEPRLSSTIQQIEFELEKAERGMAVKAATRDAAVYLNIELIGDSLLKMKSPAQGRAVSRMSVVITNQAWSFFAAVQSSRCRRQLTEKEGPHLREDLERRERFRARPS